MPINCAGSTGATSDAVDIFDATSGTWSTAALSVARHFLAATSLPNAGLAIFAGGYASALYEYTSGLMSLIVASAGMRGAMCACDELCTGAAAAKCRYVAQVQLVLLPMQSTSSMRPAEFGALLLSVSLGIFPQPHRCRIQDWQYLQAAQVRCMSIRQG
jgi:hypothetical protein